MKSPLRYPGGKTRAIKILEKFIPKDCIQICSPFFGGGSFELHLASKGLHIHGYDNFKPLVSFWQSMYCNPALVWEIEIIHDKMSKELFYQMQKNILNEPDQLKQGAMFFALNRSSFSGTTLSGGMSPDWVRFTKSSINRLDSEASCGIFNKYNPRVTVELSSFEDSIIKHDCLIYADPPYFINQKLYGNKGSLHTGFNHALLAGLLLKRGNFILTYNDCDEIRELYKWCHIESVQWSYGMNKSKVSSEIIITG